MGVITRNTQVLFERAEVKSYNVHVQQFAVGNAQNFA